MNKFQARKRFLEGVHPLIKEISSIGLSVAGSRNINEDTALEVSINNEENIEDKLKKLEDFEDFVFDGYTIDDKEEFYKVIFCQKSEERRMRDALSAHLIDLGFEIKDISETYPNQSFLLTVKIDDTALLKKLGNFEKFIFDGYRTKEDIYELVYLLP